MKIKDNLLAIESVNVFAVNWAAGASGLDYFNAATNAKVCGTSIGNFISRTGITASNVHCIGHSLGAHVCGFAGKVTKLGRITGKKLLSLPKTLTSSPMFLISKFLQ